MRIKIVKNHSYYTNGDEIDVTEERGKYLVSMGIAEEVKAVKEFVEKLEIKAPKEKAENKTDNVPNTKTKKKVILNVL